MGTTQAEAGKIYLKSNEEKLFELDKKAARHSKMLYDMLQKDQCEGQVVTVAGTDSATLTYIIEWFTKHIDDPTIYEWEQGGGGLEQQLETDQELNNTGNDGAGPSIAGEDCLSKWDKEFVERMTKPEMFQLLKAVNYLGATELEELGCRTVAGWMMGKTVEQIRELFNIEDDFSQEEKEAVRGENVWAE